MDEYQSLATRPGTANITLSSSRKCRRRTLYLELRRHLGEVFHKLAMQKESKVEEGHLMPDHVHMMLSIPPKSTGSQVVGFIKGRCEIHWRGSMVERKRSFVGQHFGREGSSSTRSGATRKLSAPIFAIRKKKT